MSDNIFIQIAAYRDPELVPTIVDILEKSYDPNNLKFGIAWQHDKNDKWDNLDIFKNDNRFKILDIDYKQSLGVCWARNIVQQLYDNETYTLQIDSHHRFVKNWDYEIIQMVKDLQSQGFEKPLITSYVPSYNPENDPAERVNVPWKMVFDKFIPEGAIFFLPSSFSSKDDNSQPLPARFYSAHFAFTLGSFAQEVQHDPNYYFHGEEISIAARAFTHGYDLFHPHKIICWHEYTRKNRTKQWDDDKQWHIKNNNCHLRNRKLFGIDGIVNDIDFGIYGFGNKRSLKDYEKYAGICFKNRSVTDDVLSDKPPSLNNLHIEDSNFQKLLQKTFKYYINIPAQKIIDKDYDFWVVAFHDSSDKSLYRKDADSSELSKIINVSNNKTYFYNIYREFYTSDAPTKWVVWPHSRSKGWCEKIEGKI